jgi:Mn2+/Fe2+ NRAMP family transporter
VSANDPAPPAQGSAHDPAPATRRARATRELLLGAAFLMATSAIGPGFLTQTAVFTAQLGASFGFAILMSILFDIGAQLNIWRVLAVAERRAPQVANQVMRGLGDLLSVLVCLGGLAFNIGNVAGAGLGLNALADVPVRVGAVVSALIAVLIFLVREAGRAMDRFALLMGFVMVVLTWYVAVASSPPLGEALFRSVAPGQIELLPIVTLVGGTVGGYITFAGAHRLLDAGVSGRAAIGEVTAAAISAIGIASLMRVVLFLAAFGIVSQGLTLDPANPPASVFRLAIGDAGYRLFGVVMWAAAITSVVGSAYTSVSFLRGFASLSERGWNRVIIAFIVLSTAIFVSVGRPVTILILVGAVNGLVLPVSLGAMLVAAHRRTIVGDYRHPTWLTVSGVLVAVAMAAMGGWTLVTELPKLLE